MPIPIPVTKTRISTTNWGIPITNEVNRMTPLVLASNPRGQVAKKVQAADNAGHTSGFEWGVALDLVVPSTPNRFYVYQFALAMVATSTPVYPGNAGAYVWYSCNVGDKSGPELAHWIIPTPQWDGGYNFFGQAVITPSPGITIGAGIYFGSGAWTIKAGSYAVLIDVGGT